MDTKSYVITAVEYLNTSFFVEGLRNSQALKEHFELVLDNPAGCSNRMINHSADIGLVPVASMMQIQPKYVFTRFCIGASQAVRTVKLLSNKPISELDTALVDSHSKTSVKLLEVLCREHWNVNLQFKSADLVGMNTAVDANIGVLAIGDKVFSIENKFKYSYDLAEEWMKMTSLDFVFAVWLSCTEISDNLMQIFNVALNDGYMNRHNHINKLQYSGKYAGIDVEHYLNHNISYPFDNSKRKGMELFLKLADLDQFSLNYK